jgi:hypothetical protein
MSYGGTHRWGGNLSQSSVTASPSGRNGTGYPGHTFGGMRVESPRLGVKLMMCGRKEKLEIKRTQSRE